MISEGRYLRHTPLALVPRFGTVNASQPGEVLIDLASFRSPLCSPCTRDACEGRSKFRSKRAVWNSAVEPERLLQGPSKIGPSCLSIGAKLPVFRLADSSDVHAAARRSLLPAVSAETATFLVTTNVDEEDGTTSPAVGAVTSLREAINAAIRHSGSTVLGTISATSRTGPVPLSYSMSAFEISGSYEKLCRPTNTPNRAFRVKKSSLARKRTRLLPLSALR